jgi:hypothetical protein
MVIGDDRAAEGVRADAGPLVRGNHAHLVGPEAERACGACERRVRLVGHVHDGSIVHRADARLAGACERGQVRRRAAGDQHSRRALGIPHPSTKPVDDDELERARPRRAEPPARVDVEGARDEVAERAGPRSLAGDEGEVAGVADACDVREDVSLEVGEDLVESGGCLRRRQRQALA